MTHLAGRWPLADLADLRAELEAAWGDPTRGYHDLRHLAEVLDRLDELAGVGVPFDRVEVVTLRAAVAAAACDAAAPRPGDGPPARGT